MKKKNKVLAAALAGAMSISLLAGCSSSAQQGGATSAGAETASASESGSAAADSTASGETTSGGADNVIRIGVIGPLTGGSAIYGEGAQNAVDMAVEEINSSGGPYTIEIVNGGELADDAQDAKQAMNAYNRVMADDPDALVGSFFSSVTLPMAAQADADGMLLLATGAFTHQANALNTLSGGWLAQEQDWMADTFEALFQGEIRKGEEAAAALEEERKKQEEAAQEAIEQEAQASQSPQVSPSASPSPSPAASSSPSPTRR